MNRRLAAALGVLALVCFCAPAYVARALDYPVHAIKLVLPQPPGGAIDLIARTLGERLSGQFKQPVIVENGRGKRRPCRRRCRALDTRRLYAVHGGRHQPGR